MCSQLVLTIHKRAAWSIASVMLLLQSIGVGVDRPCGRWIYCTNRSCFGRRGMYFSRSRKRGRPQVKMSVGTAKEIKKWRQELRRILNDVIGVNVGQVRTRGCWFGRFQKRIPKRHPKSWCRCAAMFVARHSIAATLPPWQPFTHVSSPPPPPAPLCRPLPSTHPHAPGCCTFGLLARTLSWGKPRRKFRTSQRHSRWPPTMLARTTHP